MDAARIRLTQTHMQGYSTSITRHVGTKGTLRRSAPFFVGEKEGVKSMCPEALQGKWTPITASKPRLALNINPVNKPLVIAVPPDNESHARLDGRIAHRKYPQRRQNILQRVATASRML